MYQPTLGQFLSRDPLSEGGVDILTDTGFYANRLAAMSEDPWLYGGNWEHPYAYARNNPLRFVDPSGNLSVIPVAQNLDPQCGQMAFIRWNFKLDKPSTCEGYGYIVQEVDVRCTDSPCENCGNSSPVKPDFRYWEAWSVERGDDSPVLPPGYPATDTALRQIPNNSCSNQSQVGTIKFYCLKNKLGTNTIGNRRAGWQPRVEVGAGNCLTSSGPLLATLKEPPFWKQKPIEGPAHRSFTVYWKCCCPPGFVFADAYPRIH